jgi:MFS family permease
MQPESQAAVLQQRPHRVGSFTVFRQANFRWYFLGMTLANCATWIQNVTLSWLVYDLTGSGVMLGTADLMRNIANLGLSPVAGVAIDRRSRRSLMFLTNGLYLTINAGIALALLAGITQVWPLLLVSLLSGIVHAVDFPLRQTVLFALVPRRLTPSAVGLIQTGWAVMRMLGPVIGAFFLVRVGAGGSFLLQAALYAFVILTILRLHFPRQPSARPETTVSSSFAEGLGHIVRNANARAFVFMSCVLKFFVIPVFTVMPAIFAKDLFQGGPQVLGWLLSAFGLGGVLGGLVATSLIKADHRGRVELGAMLLLGLSLVGFAFSPQLWVALVFMGLAGNFETIFIITNKTLLQLSIPDKLRGRVNGIVTLTSALMPLGALIAGSAADTIGPRPTTALMGGSAAAITLIVLLTSPTMRDYRLSQALVSEGGV